MLITHMLASMPAVIKVHQNHATLDPGTTEVHNDPPRDSHLYTKPCEHCGLQASQAELFSLKLNERRLKHLRWFAFL